METKNSTRLISAIKEGVVIDHIAPGIALQIAKLFRLKKHRRRITLALNLPSASMGEKDLIKLEERFLSDNECDQIAVLSPLATVNVIENYQVVEKMKLELPDTIGGIRECLNSRCITNSEEIPSLFHVIKRSSKQLLLSCHYCRHLFSPVENSSMGGK